MLGLVTGGTKKGNGKGIEAATAAAAAWGGRLVVSDGAGAGAGVKAPLLFFFSATRDGYVRIYIRLVRRESDWRAKIVYLRLTLDISYPILSRERVRFHVPFPSSPTAVATFSTSPGRYLPNQISARYTC